MPGQQDPVAAAPHTFRDVGFAQGIPQQGQANALVSSNSGSLSTCLTDTSLQENREYDLLDHVPQHVIPGPAQAAFHPPFVHQALIPDQLREDSLRRLARRFLYHPDSRVNMVWMEPGAAGRFKVVIVLEASDVLY